MNADVLTVPILVWNSDQIAGSKLVLGSGVSGVMYLGRSEYLT